MLEPSEVAITLIVGAIAGWLGSLFVGGSRGLVRNVVVGLIGSVVGGLLFRYLPFNLSFGNAPLGTILHAAVGSIIVLLVARFIAK
jgi:uncharacterized membrane protein YeaQ/YmgE (transglycosylase-associated protein family)